MPLKRLLIFILAIGLLAAGAAQTIAVTTGGKTRAQVAEGDNPPKDDSCDDNKDDNAADQQYDDDDDDDCVKPPEDNKPPANDDKPGNGDDNKSNPGSNNASPNGQAASTALPKGPVTCTSRRRFPLRLWFGAGRVRGGSVTVNGTPSHVVKSGRLSHTMVDLRRLNRGTYTVAVKVRFASGRSITFVRRYRTCTSRRVAA